MYKIVVPKSELIAQITFIIFIFTTFFGTTLPFQDTQQVLLKESGSIETSNIVNVLLFPTLFMLSFLAFLPKYNEILQILKKEKLLTLFFIWALLTIGWSEFPFTSFKRWFQQITYFFIPLVYFSYCKSIKDVIKAIKPTIYIYLLVSIVVVFIVPEATDPRFGTWRGLMPHKNHLGQIALISIVFTSIVYFAESTLKRKVVALFFLLIGISLLIGANSSTAIIGFLLFLLGSLTYVFLNKMFGNIGTGKFISIFSLIMGLTIFILIYKMAPELADSLNITGKNIDTMSSRTFLWEYMLSKISNHIFFGCGFRGFWVVDSNIVDKIWSLFLYLPIQAHNGYLDILNEGGIIATMLLVGIIVNYFVISLKEKVVNLWSWLFILPIISNFTESILFREGIRPFIFFLIAYLIIFFFDRNGENRSLNQDEKFRKTNKVWNKYSHNV